MRLAQVTIENFRAFREQVVELSDYTCLVGPNGAGKSTILTALKVFFRDTSDSTTDLAVLQEEDFHKRDTSRPVRITVVFEDLSQEAQQDFADYYRQGKLIITAQANWDPATSSAPIKQYGQRLAFHEFKDYFKALGDGAKVADLKTIYGTLQNRFSDLPRTGTKDEMTGALRAYESAHLELLTAIQSEDQFYGFSRGANKLAKYVQWICVPAVKDVTTEQTEAKKTALGMLLERTVRCKMSFKEPLDALRQDSEKKYCELLVLNQAVLTEIGNTLNQRLQEWAHPDVRLQLNWQPASVSIPEPVAQIAAGEGDFMGRLARMGHGLQRCYLLALLQELSGCDDPMAPRLILACEEPELYQHPPQCRHLSDVYLALAKGNCQVIVSTHSPYFVTGRGFLDVRIVRKNAAHESNVYSVSRDELSATLAQAIDTVPEGPSGAMLKIEQALQPAINEMFFTPVLVLVEGIEDLSYLTTYINLMEGWQEYRGLGCHIVPVGGKSKIIRPLAIAKHLKIPTLVVFDSDGHKPNKNGSREMHEKDNMAILRLCSADKKEAFPKDTLWLDNVIMWKSELGKVVSDEIGEEAWQKTTASTREKYEIDVDNLSKNGLFIAYVLEEAWTNKLKSPSLEQACKKILAFAKSVKAGELDNR